MSLSVDHGSVRKAAKDVRATRSEVDGELPAGGAGVRGGGRGVGAMAPGLMGAGAGGAGDPNERETWLVQDENVWDGNGDDVLPAGLVVGGEGWQA